MSIWVFFGVLLILAGVAIYSYYIGRSFEPVKRRRRK